MYLAIPAVEGRGEERGGEREMEAKGEGEGEKRRKHVNVWREMMLDMQWRDSLADCLD